MRIAQLIASYLDDGIGGAQICVHNVSKRLSESGHHIAVVTATAGKNPLGYEVVNIPRFLMTALYRNIPFAPQSFIFYLKQIQKHHRFDLWQVTMGYPLGIAAVDFFKRAHIPCVLRSSGEDIQKDSDLSYGYRLNPKIDRWVKKYYPQFDAFVSISKSMSDEYRALGIPDGKIHFIPNGVDCTRFQNTPQSDAIREKHGIARDKKIILTVGRHHPKKGYELIPAMVASLLKKRNDFVWIVVGRGTASVREACREERIRSHLIAVEELYANSQDATQLPSQELIKYYKNADVFVFPSYIETFGIVLIEAMAAGIPVITTDVPGCRDVVSDGTTGLLAKAGDAQEIANYIQRLLDDDALRRALINEGLKIAQKHDWNMITKKYGVLYRSLICQK